VEVIAEYRRKLLAVLAKLDQLQAEAETILADPGDAETGAMVEELREMHVEMQARVEEKLDRLAR
jgi:hypothetical protein